LKVAVSQKQIREGAQYIHRSLAHPFRNLDVDVQGIEIKKGVYLFKQT
jgi:hypothetical protein